MGFISSGSAFGHSDLIFINLQFICLCKFSSFALYVLLVQCPLWVYCNLYCLCSFTCEIHILAFMPSCSCEIRFLVSDKIYFYDLWYWNRHRALCLAARKTDAIEFYLPGLKCPFDLLPSLRRRPQELHSHRLPYIIYRVIFLAHFMLR